MTERARRLLDPFDVMRATRTLAPHDPKLNDIRWLTGEALRRAHEKAKRARIEIYSLVLHAREQIAACESKAGPAAWPIVTRIVLQDAGVRECRDLNPEIVTPWRADAVITDRLRVALDALAPIFGLAGGKDGRRLPR